MELDFESGLKKAARQCLELLDLKSTPIVLIDGPAASGKSTFAALLAEEIFAETKQLAKLIHMDDLYPGWEGLRAGSSYLTQTVLQPLRAGKQANWQLWDWDNSIRGRLDEEGNGWRSFEGGNLLIVEGCGAISRQNSELADLRFWLAAERDLREERWISREGSREFFDIWAAQEDEFYELERSRQLADLVLTN